MTEKPKSALNAMLSRVTDHADALHEELHEFEDELSHHVSHLLKKIAKLTAYAELEAPNNQSAEVVTLITRNMAEINEDLTDLLDDAGTDPAIHSVGDAISNLVAIMSVEWHSAITISTAKGAEDPRDIFLLFEQSLKKLVPTARADIAVRHAYLALREMEKFWRANDDRLARLAHGHVHEHGHAHEPKNGFEDGHHHPMEI